MNKLIINLSIYFFLLHAGVYSQYYTSATASIYPSGGYYDSLAHAAGWLYRATGDASYLDKAADFFTKGANTNDVYPSWDSVSCQHAVHMINLANQGQTIPGLAEYKAYVHDQFLNGWVENQGTNNIFGHAS